MEWFVEQDGMHRPSHRLTRREILGGGLALSVMALAGCATRSATGERASHANLERFLRRHPDGFEPNVTPADPTPAWTPPGVLPRSSWTRAGVARPREIFSMRGVNQITVHHDGMPPVTLRSREDVIDRIELIRRSHVESRGFADIGYHYIIDPQGRVWEGRSESYQGAQVRDHNEHNLGVLVLGNFQEQTPTRAATSAVDRFVASQMKRFGVTIGRVHTHQELVPTSCPGRSLQRYMVRTRSGSGGLAMAAGSLDERLVG